MKEVRVVLETVLTLNVRDDVEADLDEIIVDMDMSFRSGTSGVKVVDWHNRDHSIEEDDTASDLEEGQEDDGEGPEDTDTEELTDDEEDD